MLCVHGHSAQVCAVVYLCEALISRDRVDLHVLALLNEPQVGVVGLVVVHVERLKMQTDVTLKVTFQALAD